MSDMSWQKKTKKQNKKKQKTKQKKQQKKTKRKPWSKVGRRCINNLRHSVTSFYITYNVGKGIFKT